MMLRRRLGLLIVIGLIGCDHKTPTSASADAAPQPQSLPTVRMDLNGTPFDLQVARDDATREKGLMFVHQMPTDGGMIFVFPVERPLAFWMKNTPIDLDIIYADHAGRVVSVKTMHAYDTSDVPSDEPATYAIELNAGAATRARVSVGQMLDMPTDLASHAR